MSGSDKELSHSVTSELTVDIRQVCLLWFGIVGCAISVFASLKGILEFSDIVSALHRQWLVYTQAFWEFVFSWFSIKLPTVFTPLLTYFVFLISIGVSCRRSWHLNSSNNTVASPTLSMSTAVMLYLGLIVPILLVQIFFVVNEMAVPALLNTIMTFFPFLVGGLIVILCKDRPAALFFLILFWVTPLLFMASIGDIVSLATLDALMRLDPSLADEAVEQKFAVLREQLVYDIGLMSGIYGLVAKPTLPLWLALLPVRLMIRQFIFVAIGVSIIFALNEMSKLGLMA